MMEGVMSFELTPTQQEAIERSRAFRRSIEQRAVPQTRPRQKSKGVKGYQVSAESAEPKKVLPPMPDIIWPVIPTIDKITVARIQVFVAKHYGIPVSEMKSPRRLARLAHARQVAMYISKVLTPNSLPEIGRRFGNRDHTTVLHAVRKITAMMQRDKKFSAEITCLQNSCETIG